MTATANLLPSVVPWRAKLRNVVKAGLSRHPAVFIPTFRAFGPRDKQDLLISAETKIVIEGFPRSCNTFAVVAFEAAQPAPVSIAHHLHSEAQILRGVARGLPVVALIREPLAAVRSLKVIFPHVDENRALRRWLNFYEAVDRCKEDVVLADFRQVTTDFGAIIARVNARFGTDFAVFNHTQTHVDEVYRRIEAIDQRLRGGADMYVARPSQVKRKAQADMTYRFDPWLAGSVQAMFRQLVPEDSDPY